MRVAQAEGVSPKPFDGFDGAAFMPGTSEADARQSLANLAAFNTMTAKSHSGLYRDLAVRKRRTEVDAAASRTAVTDPHALEVPPFAPRTAAAGAASTRAATRVRALVAPTSAQHTAAASDAPSMAAARAPPRVGSHSASPMAAAVDAPSASARRAPSRAINSVLRTATATARAVARKMGLRTAVRVARRRSQQSSPRCRRMLAPRQAPTR